MTSATGPQSVCIIQNGNLFYVTDEKSKIIFDKQLGLPFDTFGIDQKDYVAALLKRAKIKVTLLPAMKVIQKEISVPLQEWTEHQPFKSPIKKRFTVCDELSKIEFAHLGPTAKTAVQKAASISKCQDSIHPFILRAWELLENHFYVVKMFDSVVETSPHKSGTIIRISYPLQLQLDGLSPAEESDEE